MALSTPAISCRGLSKSYGSTLALDAVDFTAHYGQVTGLLGPNGAGKTTLIRVLTTILPPSSGSFTVAGLGPSDAVGIRARVGVLPESGGYPRRKTAFDHVAYHASLYGLGPDEARGRAADLLAEVGLAGRRSDRIGSFSRGMRQRLGIARALVNDPDVLFLDEPTLGLDPAGQRQILELVGRLAAEREAAVVLTSHLLDEVERTSDRIVILDRGRVVLDRPAGETSVPPTRPAAVPLRVLVAPGEATDASQVADSLGFAVRPGAAGALEGTAVDEIQAMTLLKALVDAGITVRRFEAGGSRLADEFMEVTES